MKKTLLALSVIALLNTSSYCALQRNILLMNRFLEKCFIMHTDTAMLGEVGVIANEGCLQAQIILDFIIGKNFVENIESLDNNFRYAQPITNEPESEKNIVATAYPNPTNGKIKFEYNLPNEKQGELIIYDITGKSLFVLKLQNSNGEI